MVRSEGPTAQEIESKVRRGGIYRTGEKRGEYKVEVGEKSGAGKGRGDREVG